MSDLQIPHDCDLVMARDEIAAMHRIVQAEAEREGSNAYFQEQYVAAWQRFRDSPTRDNAQRFLETAPPLIRYFEMCSPGAQMHGINKALEDHDLDYDRR